MVKYRVDYSQILVVGLYDKHLEHYGRMKKLLEAHQTKVALTEFRKKRFTNSKQTELSKRI